MDPIKLPIQLDAPIKALTPDGREWTIAEACMVNGEIQLTLTPSEDEERDPAVMSDTELYGAGSE